MASKHREEKIIASVDCPECRAKRDELCRVNTTSRLGQGRPVTHTARREAWQRQRASEWITVEAMPLTRRALKPTPPPPLALRVVNQTSQDAAQPSAHVGVDGSKDICFAVLEVPKPSSQRPQSHFSTR
jgi:hypothetical protein